jgi:Mrp family chromosome partitioning ATPase
MARMLQALKNLEARSVRPAGWGAVAPVAGTGPEQEAPEIKRPTRRAEATQPPIDVSLDGVASEAATIDAVASALAGLDVAVENAPARSEIAASGAADWKKSAPQPVGDIFSASPPGTAVSSRPASGLERLVRRTIGDRSRSQPLVELADRLRRDMEQAGAKTLIFVGVGAASATCEILLYAATLLAEEKRRGKVLLVDADLARGALSESLEYGQERGLTELLRDDNFFADACRPTAAERLSFLPLGLQRHADLSTVSPRLAQVLERFIADFSCVLIDGGRTGDLSVNALARQVDAAYLVVQLGTVETNKAQAALAEFRAAGARVLGCIAT